MAGILITGINLIGGIVIGVVQQKMQFAEAGQHFSLLSVGDGLCAQIPALLISVATGILVTRSGDNEDLGTTVSGQILDQRKAPLIAGVVVLVFGLVPGLPKIPFFFVGALLIAIGWTLKNEPTKTEREETEKAQAAAGAAPDQLPAPRDAALEALALDPLELAIGFGLVPLVDQGAGGTLLQRVGTIRRQIASELGMVIPPVRIRDDMQLDSHEYVMRVRGTEVARGGIMAGHHLAMDPGDAVGQLDGIPTQDPAYGMAAVWITDAGRAEAEALGWTVVDPESVVVTHLTETIRAHASELLTRQETRHLLDQLKEVNAAVVDEVVPDVLSLGEIQRVLQALLRENVSIRDLGSVVEAVGDKARLTRDPAMLAEYARQALGRTIVAPYLDAESTLRAIALDPGFEQEIAEALVQTADGEFLAMDPGRAQALVQACASHVEHSLAAGGRPVLLCSARVRRHLRRLVEQRLPQLAVCSYNEVAPGVGVETIAVLGSAAAPDALPVL
jgi:flagellar biosynthesis protein FlhA